MKKVNRIVPAMVWFVFRKIPVLWNLWNQCRCSSSLLKRSWNKSSTNPRNIFSNRIPTSLRSMTLLKAFTLSSEAQGQSPRNLPKWCTRKRRASTISWVITISLPLISDILLVSGFFFNFSLYRQRNCVCDLYQDACDSPVYAEKQASKDMISSMTSFGIKVCFTWPNYSLSSCSHWTNWTNFQSTNSCPLPRCKIMWKVMV